MAVQLDTVDEFLKNLEIRVLGVDLASRHWAENGTAVLAFRGMRWTSCAVDVLRWPGGVPNAQTLAEMILSYCIRHDIRAVALDGPLGWRDPNATAGSRPGVGRVAEYAVRAQGKTGNYGVCYPRTQRRWVELCVAVFAHLLRHPQCALVNSDSPMSLEAGQFAVLETFPTMTWRTCGMKPLPSRRATTPEVQREALRGLARTFAMPPDLLPVDCTHDEVQAIVAALAGVAVQGGPARPVFHGVPAFHCIGSSAVPRHLVEGYILAAAPYNLQQ